MNRAILFRGKSTGDLSPWIYGYYHYDNATECHYICDKDTLYRYEVDPDTVGQAIGLKDCADIDIFEGDILSWTSWKKDKSDTQLVYNNVVEFFAGGTMCGYRIRRKSFMKPLHRNGIHNAKATIVGNKWDNPELMKEG